MPEIIDGQYFCIYLDYGPSGISAQSMNITCPHTYLYLFKSKDDMQEHLDRNLIGRNGVSKIIRSGVIGSGINSLRVFTC